MGKLIPDCTSGVACCALSGSRRRKKTHRSGLKIKKQESRFLVIGNTVVIVDTAAVLVVVLRQGAVFIAWSLVQLLFGD